jgi:hypothetical protein
MGCPGLRSRSRTTRGLQVLFLLERHGRGATPLATEARIGERRSRTGHADASVAGLYAFEGSVRLLGP